MREDREHKIQKGCEYLNAGRFDGAIELFSSILDITSADDEVLNYLGLAWNGKGDYDRAIDYFDLAIRKPILLHLLAGVHEKRAVVRSSREELDHRPPLATRSEPVVLMGFDFSPISYPPM